MRKNIIIVVLIAVSFGVLIYAWQQRSALNLANEKLNQLELELENTRDMALTSQQMAQQAMEEAERQRYMAEQALEEIRKN